MDCERTRGNEQMNNNEEFLDLFGKIEKKINELVGLQSFQMEKSSFSNLISPACQVNPAIREVTKQLNNYALIRNILSHESRKDIISVPEQTLNEIKKVCELVLNPPTVYHKFKRVVYTCDVNSLLLTVLKEMKEKVYTHVPVYENKKFIGVLSEVSVVNWLTENHNTNLSKVLVGELKQFINDQFNEFFEFVGKEVNAYVVREWFHEKVKDGKRLGAVFITEDGLPNGKLIGVITAWDLPLLRIREV
nr:hypothetical protein [uncultured archaeon]